MARCASSKTLLHFALVLSLFASCVKKTTNSLQSSNSKGVPQADTNTLEKYCKNGLVKSDVTIEEIDALVYKLALARGESFPEVASPTMRVLEKRVGIFGEAVYLMESRNIISGKPILASSEQSVVPGRHKDLSCLDFSRDGHSALPNLGKIVNSSVIDVLQIKTWHNATGGDLYSLPSPQEHQLALKELQRKLPSHIVMPLGIAPIEEGKVTSVQNYVLGFAFSGMFPRGTSGWMFFHDLFTHAAVQAMVPPKLATVIRNLATEALLFSRFARKHSKGGKKVSQDILLSVADSLDLWSARMAAAFDHPFVNSVLQKRKSYSRQVMFEDVFKRDTSIGLFKSFGDVFLDSTKGVVNGPLNLATLIFDNKGDYSVKSNVTEEIFLEFLKDHPEIQMEVLQDFKADSVARDAVSFYFDLEEAAAKIMEQRH
jgi:hypothetical protein